MNEVDRHLGVLSASLRHSAHRINALAKKLGSKTYLEIGVSKGHTFLGVDIASKDAVDPNFQFDISRQATDQVRFFDMTSDRFFVGHADRKYDIIFLDGLHTFEQTFRDFCATLSFSHQKTVWLIDDTMPNSIFSAHRNIAESMNAQESHGIANRSWHGDVYKIVPAIHDFFPQMSYATIKSGPNPQTLVWFAPRVDFKPRFNDLETITRLDYYQFVKLQDIYRIVTSDEAATRLVPT